MMRNGYATIRDLDSPSLTSILEQMEQYQLQFLGTTRSLWKKGLFFTGDSLYHWSRQWEYPYCVANLEQGTQARLLDAGSGITFLPFYLAHLGHEVHCVDTWPDLAECFEHARRATGLSVNFKRASFTQTDYPDAFFRTVVCLSVLEHLTPHDRDAAIAEFARVLELGGRLILTCDISVGRDSEILLEDFAVLLRDLQRWFTPQHPLQMRRSADLLTTDIFRVGSASWRLPWRPRPATFRNRFLGRAGKLDFESLTVVGLTLRRS